MRLRNLYCIVEAVGLFHLTLIEFDIADISWVLIYRNGIKFLTTLGGSMIFRLSIRGILLIALFFSITDLWFFQAFTLQLLKKTAFNVFMLFFLHSLRGESPTFISIKTYLGAITLFYAGFLHFFEPNIANWHQFHYGMQIFSDWAMFSTVLYSAHRILPSTPSWVTRGLTGLILLAKGVHIWYYLCFDVSEPQNTLIKCSEIHRYSRVWLTRQLIEGLLVALLGVIASWLFLVHLRNPLKGVLEFLKTLFWSFFWVVVIKVLLNIRFSFLKVPPSVAIPGSQPSLQGRWLFVQEKLVGGLLALIFTLLPHTLCQALSIGSLVLAVTLNFFFDPGVWSNKYFFTITEVFLYPSVYELMKATMNRLNYSYSLSSSQSLASFYLLRSSATNTQNF